MQKKKKMASTVIDVYVKLPSGENINFNLQSTDAVQKIYDHVSNKLI